MMSLLLKNRGIHKYKQSSCLAGIPAIEIISVNPEDYDCGYYHYYDKLRSSRKKWEEFKKSVGEWYLQNHVPTFDICSLIILMKDTTSYYINYEREYCYFK